MSAGTRTSQNPPIKTSLSNNFYGEETWTGHPWGDPTARSRQQMRRLVAFLKDQTGTIQIDYLMVAVIFSFVVFIGVNVVTLALQFY